MCSDSNIDYSNPDEAFWQGHQLAEKELRNEISSLKKEVSRLKNKVRLLEENIKLKNRVKELEDGIRKMIG